MFRLLLTSVVTRSASAFTCRTYLRIGRLPLECLGLCRDLNRTAYSGHESDNSSLQPCSLFCFSPSQELFSAVTMGRIWGFSPQSLGLLLCVALSKVVLAKEFQGDTWCGTLMCTTAFVNSSNTITCELPIRHIPRYKLTRICKDQLISLNQLGWMAM